MSWLPPLEQGLDLVRAYFNSSTPHPSSLPSSNEAPAPASEPWVLVIDGEPPSVRKEVATADKIEKWAPHVLVAFVVTCCFFRYTGAFALGLAFAAYQKKYPDQLSTTVDQLAQTYFPFKGKKFGMASVIVESPLTQLATIALASMWSGTFAQMKIIAYFAYRVTTAILSTQPNEIKQDTKP